MCVCGGGGGGSLNFCIRSYIYFKKPDAIDINICWILLATTLVFIGYINVGI